ncbi:uncharacterized protein LOC128959065 [Oppia nitens]|uniref:uncharacterized protein LOC128959065 n=1 Tax=Oppia nitens TaxID=1686743 RepID=UPI0023DBDC17|nr:uncharacterized protein LOC128959065 [Oppia nitens]
MKSTLLSIKFITVLIVILVVSIDNVQNQSMDAIGLLASCGNQCWKQDPHTNKSPETINPGPEPGLDTVVVRCMQQCFAEKTKKPNKDEKLPPIQILKIKVSAYCGHICYTNNKLAKRALDYCYAGCLGTILQSAKVTAQQQNNNNNNNRTIG